MSAVSNPWVLASYTLALLVGVSKVVLLSGWSPHRYASEIWSCAAGLTCLLVLHAWKRDEGDGGPRLWQSRVLAGVTVLLAVGAFAETQWSNVERVRRDELPFPINCYHYYMGSKYFDELGYSALYEQTIVASRDAQWPLGETTKIRNLRDYSYWRDSEYETFERRPAFSDERWGEFAADLAYFAEATSPGFWEKVLRDRGYNATPFWNTVGSSLTNAVDITDARERKLLIVLDPLLGLIAASACLWAFGPITTALMFLLFFLGPMNDHRIMGGVLAYDWFYAILMGFAFFKKERWVLSSLCWSYAIMTRVFPLLILMGLVVPTAIQLAKTRKIDPGHARFFAGIAVLCSLFFALGGLNTQGFGAWQDFKSNLVVHDEAHAFGNQRSGMKHLFTQNLFGAEKPEGRTEKMETFEEQKTFFYVTAGAMLAMLLLTLRRKEGVAALVWGVPLFFIVAVSSRYYWSVFVLLLLLDSKKGDQRPSLAGGLFGFVYLGWWLFYLPDFETRYANYVFANLLVATGIFLLLAREVGKDVLGLARRRSG